MSLLYPDASRKEYAAPVGKRERKFGILLPGVITSDGRVSQGGWSSEYYAAVAAQRWPMLQTAQGVAILKRICDTISSMPVKLVDSSDPEGEVELPLPEWWVDPLPGVSFYTNRVMRWMGAASLILDGNLFGLILDRIDEEQRQAITQGESDISSGVWILDPSLVQVAGTWPNPEFQVSTSGLGGMSLSISNTFTSDQVVWQPYLPIPLTARGLSPFSLGMTPVDVSVAAQDHVRDFFDAGANSNPVINVRGTLEEEDEEELKAKFRNRTTGKRSQDPIITFGPDVSVDSISIDPRNCLLYTSPSPRD